MTSGYWEISAISTCDDNSPRSDVNVKNLHDSWKSHGYVDLPNLVDDDCWEAIEREAHQFEPDAFPRVNARVDLEDRRDGSIVAPQKCRAHLAGPALRALATSHEFRALVTTATGLNGLVPARLGYKYYMPGDFMAVHRDDVKCTITVSFGVTKNLDHMGWMPALRGASNEDVIARAVHEGHFPSSGERFDIRHRKMRGFDGYNIPHWRPPFEYSLGILGFVCFFDL
jgi:hypothetical protein